MRIDAYFLCFNESYILPHLIKHYSGVCQHIYFFDNMSTDDSARIIGSFPNTTVISWDSGNQVRDDLYLSIKNNCWKESRGRADYVIVGDADEFLFHPNLINFLKISEACGYTIFRPEGYHMIGDFDLDLKPEDDILSTVTKGIRGESNDKLMLFNPDAIREINFLPGCHRANPIGSGQLCVDPHLKMLHFKYLGFNNFLEKQLLRGSRLSDFNRKSGLGLYYLYSPERHKNEYESFVKLRRRVDLLV